MAAQFADVGNGSGSEQISAPGSTDMVTCMTGATPAADENLRPLSLTNAELCQSAASGLTHDSRRAEVLVKGSLVWARQLQGAQRDEARHKVALLQGLRGGFLCDRRSMPRSCCFDAPQVPEEAF